SKSYDLAVLGGGIGGYSAAVRASSYGMEVAIVEENTLAGTCLHEGCIPPQSYIGSADTYRKTEDAALFGLDGIELKTCHITSPKVSKKAKSVVSTLRQGLNQLRKQKKIDMYFGRGTILGASIFSPLPGNISVEKEDGRDNIILS